MRRLMMLALLPVLGGVFWAVACEHDNYRSELPLRPFGDLAPQIPDLALGPPPDLTRPPADMAAPADLAPPADLTMPPDLTPADM
jgi:hypothetical protein